MSLSFYCILFLMFQMLTYDKEIAIIYVNSRIIISIIKMINLSGNNNSFYFSLLILF